MYRAARRIQELLQELTDLGRGRERSLEDCSLLDIVKAACEMIGQQSHLDSPCVTIEIPDDIRVFVERGRIERVFTNLVNNAREAMPEGGQISISAHRELTSVLVQFKDSGPGLSDDAWATLFQPFASFGKRNGLGLGLALARQTVLEHGGDLWADRDAGPGAVFYLRLPLAGTAENNHREVSSDKFVSAVKKD
jgi:signal transduction histidine kinase